VSVLITAEGMFLLQYLVPMKKEEHSVHSMDLWLLPVGSVPAFLICIIKMCCKTYLKTLVFVAYIYSLTE